MYLSPRTILVRGILCGILVCLILMITASTGSSLRGYDHNQYQVILVSENKDYELQDNVTIEIKFFDLQVPTDPDDINLSIDGGDRYIEKEPTQLSTGHYTLTFEVFDEDYGDWVGFDILVTCTVNGSRGEELYVYSEIWISLVQPVFHAELTVDKPIFEPGDNVTFRITSTLDGIPADVDMLDIDIYENGGKVMSYSGNPKMSMPLVGVGIYEYWYQAPYDNISKEVTLHVRNIGWDAAIIWDLEVTAVRKFFDIWMFVDDQNGTQFDGKIGVTDLSGNPLECDMTVDYSYFNNTCDGWTCDYSFKNFTGETGTDGLMDIHLEYPDIYQNPWGFVDLYLNATEKGSRDGSSYTQAVHFRIPNRFFSHTYYIWKCEPQFDDKIPLPINTQVKLEYIVTINGTPLQNMDLISYVYSGNAYGWIPGGSFDDSIGTFYGAQAHTTDSQGRFFLELTTPDHPEEINLWFKGLYGEPDSEEWREDHQLLMVTDFFDIDQDLQMEIENFGSGQVATVRLSIPGIEGGSGDAFILSIDPSQTSGIEDVPFPAIFPDRFGNTWAPLIRLNEPIQKGFSGDSFETTITVPTFSPSENHFIIAGYIEPSGSPPNHEIIPQKVHWNYIIIDINGNPIQGLRSFTIFTDAPAVLDSEDSIEILVTVTEGPGVGGATVEDASVVIEVGGPASASTTATMTNTNGRISFRLTVEEVTENTTITLFVNATKDGYVDGPYSQVVSIRGSGSSSGGDPSDPNEDDDAGGGVPMWFILVLVIIIVGVVVLYMMGIIPQNSEDAGSPNDEMVKKGSNGNDPKNEDALEQKKPEKEQTKDIEKE